MSTTWSFKMMSTRQAMRNGSISRSKTKRGTSQLKWTLSTWYFCILNSVQVRFALSKRHETTCFFLKIRQKMASKHIPSPILRELDPHRKRPEQMLSHTFFLLRIQVWIRWSSILPLLSLYFGRLPKLSRKYQWFKQSKIVIM